jgi:hypothetical protein
MGRGRADVVVVVVVVVAELLGPSSLAVTRAYTRPSP